MEKSAEVEVFTPPNTLKQRLGGALPKLDEQAVERAERALKTLAVQFDDWMDEELGKLEAAWAQVKARGLSGDAGHALFLAAHDIKGLGTTYSFPLVTRLAAPLCRLIETPELRAAAKPILVEALLNGVRRAIRDRIRTDAHPTGRALAQEGEAIVAHLLRGHEA
jgi:hypothetical protein